MATVFHHRSITIHRSITVLSFIKTTTKMVKAFILALIVALQIICGNGFTIQPRIVNGVLSNPEAFPFYVFLFKGDGRQAATCGGTLISDKWIVTAAHCLEWKTDITLFFAVDEIGQFHGAVDVPVERQFINPEYEAASHANDIGLIELPFEIEANNFIHPVILPTDCGNDLDNEDVIAVGNGKQSFDRDARLDTRLRHVYLQALQSDVCESRTASTPPGSIICALPDQGQSINQGDSGGPLLRGKNGALVGITSSVVLGIVDFGYFKETTPFLQKFTKLHYYFDWISEKTGLDLPKCERPT